MEPVNRDDRVKKGVAMARRWLKDHELLVHHEVFPRFGIIEIGKPQSSNYRVSFTLTPGGYLTMTGDIDTVCWAHFHGSTVEGAVRWMARSHPMDHYFVEKAGIGMGGRDLVHTYDAQVAFGDAIEYRKDAKRQGDEDEAENWATVLRAMADEGYEDREDVMRLVASFDDDWERAGTIGMAPAWRLIWAWLLIRKAVELLDAVPEAERLHPVCVMPPRGRDPRTTMRSGIPMWDRCLVGPHMGDTAWECEDCEQEFCDFVPRLENEMMDWFCKGGCDRWNRCVR